MRIGIGYDSHRFAAGDGIMIGGVHVPFHYGVSAHSDGDVLLHALCDALLGALALGDIGQHFSDQDPQYAGVSSLMLLQQVLVKMKQQQYRLVNMDAVVICEAPKLQPHIETMRCCIAQALEVELQQISVKATTNEKMGFIGREEGLAAQVVVMLESEFG